MTSKHSKRLSAQDGVYIVHKPIRAIGADTDDHLVVKHSRNWQRIVKDVDLEPCDIELLLRSGAIERIGGPGPSEGEAKVLRLER